MRKTLFLIVLIIGFALSGGCVQISEKERASGNGLMGYEETEHLYLWGEHGPLTKEYDIRIWALGIDVAREKGISEARRNAYQKEYNDAVKTLQSTTTSTPVKTPTPIRSPTQSSSKHQLTEGYWCLESIWKTDSGNRPIRDCYQFFSDGSMATGTSDAKTMIRVNYCTNNNVCSYNAWKIDSNGQYIIMDQICTFTGHSISCPGFNPHTWSATGV